MQRKLNNLIREMSLSSPKGALDPWAGSETHHHELMPYRLKGDLLLWGMGLRKDAGDKHPGMVKNLGDG